MKIVRNNDFIMREIAGETFLIPVGEASVQINGMITLNGMSAFIWKALETEKTEEELIKEILNVYEAGEKQVKEDLAEFLERMKSLNMVKIS